MRIIWPHLMAVTFKKVHVETFRTIRYLDHGSSIHITQYGSTVYIGMAMGCSALQPYIRKFQFSLSVSIQSDF